MAQEAEFKCLRCGTISRLPYSPETEPQERACPKCKSNSMRRIKEQKQAKS
ncbi:MAG: hypothetical protein V2A71_00530 [Candidatus Eisenbacteria bacterium]